MNLVITEFNNRRNPVGTVRSLTWEELKDKLRHPVITDESVEEYQQMTNEDKTSIKDVGGFVGGELADGKRSKATLVSRSVLSIDADEATLDKPDEFAKNYPYVFFCHTTHTSTEDKPRLRWVLPLSRPVTGEEYSKIVSVVCGWVGGDTVDATTDQPERLMFWPSSSWDSDYRYWENGTEYINPDDVLPQYIGEEISESAQVSSSSSSVEIIGEGSRNQKMYAFACTLRGLGLEYENILSSVADHNQRYCCPPLTDDEVRTICRSACKHEAGDRGINLVRTLEDDFGDLGEVVAIDKPRKKKDKEKDPPRRMSGVSLADLCNRHIDPPKFIVDSLISVGLTILAAPPKFGKSWWCMDLAISVANGTDFFGMKTNKCAVVYLALEDGDYRLKDRGIKVAGNREIPKNLLFIKETPSLEENFYEELDRTIDEFEKECGEKVGLVIVDTFQRIRGVAGKTEGVYSHDYREAGTLQKWALGRSTSLVLVHHTNKNIDENDPFASINGTNGLPGACDVQMVFSRKTRDSNYTKLHTTGRDVEQRTLVMRMDWGTYRWICLGEEQEVEADQESISFKEDPVVKTIIYKLDECEELCDADESDAKEVVWECTSAELLDTVTSLYGKPEVESAVAVGRYVAKLADNLELKEGISYEYKRTTRSRVHSFTRDRL